MAPIKQCLDQLVQRVQTLVGFSAMKTHRGLRQGSAQNVASYQSLEPRKLLATLTVDTASDVVDLNDGLISLREAITATNTNAAFGDAPAGDATGDSINFASSLSGQAITLGGSELVIEDDLIIRGGNPNVTISGNDASRIFRIATAEEVVLSRLNLVAGQATDGGALLTEGGGTVRLFESLFISNEVTGNGGAVFNGGSRLLITGSSFTASFAVGSGGTIYSEGGSTNFSNSIISGSRAGVNGGAIATDGGEHVFFETTIERNAVNVFGGDGGGGGLYVGGADASALFLRSNISNNNARDGGGIYLEAENRLSIFADTVISDNTARDPGGLGDFGNGGGIFSRGTNVSIGSSEVSGNSATTSGGGIYSDGGFLNVSNTEINDNLAQDDGGGIAAEGSQLFLRGVTFRRNLTTGFTNAPNRISSGGGLYIGAADTSSSAVVFSSIFQFNSSYDIGGAIYNAGTSVIGSTFIGGNEALGTDSAATGGGGGIFNEGDRLTISNTTIQNNRTFTSRLGRAGRGGGVYSSSSSVLGTRGELNINNSFILRNRAEELGGGIAIEGGEATLFETNVGNRNGDGNRAGLLPSEAVSATSEEDREFEGLGGGIWIGTEFAGQAAPSLTVFGGVIGNNVANDSGGGLYSSNANVIFRAANSGRDNTVFRANRALVRDGGGAFVAGGSLLLLDSIFEDNTSRNGGGFFVTDNAELNLRGSAVQSNEARRSGGGLYLDQGIEVNLADVTVESNDATFGPDVFEA